MVEVKKMKISVLQITGASEEEMQPKYSTAVQSLKQYMGTVLSDSTIKNGHRLVVCFTDEALQTAWENAIGV